MKRGANKKIAAYKRGMFAEKLAAVVLRLKGYKILRHRYKTPFGEIDLVARKGKYLVFVEVKDRPDFGAALEAVSPRNQARVEQAARYFLSAHPHYAEWDMRFDVIVTGRPFSWRHLDNAWQSRT
ncbi:MAG: YraN family protein [Alphaproteobacteria bacterium]|nr:YraN family protein [Alphaproteobacteria bacterium]